MFRSSIALSALLLIPYASPAQAFQPAQTQQSGSERTLTVPTGATIPIRLNRAIDTKTAKAGDSFQGSIAANVLSGAFVALPVGAPITGRVVDAKAAGRISGAAKLSLELVSVQINGQTVAITTHELSSKNNGRGPNTIARTGGGAALGAIIGGIAGGGVGAGIGAVSGGGLGAGSNIIRPGQQIVLSSEALLRFQTAAAVEVATAAQPGGLTGTGHGGGVHGHSDYGSCPTIPGQQDPRAFDIVGLQLGMTAQQASAAISTRVPQVTKSAFQHGTPQFTTTAQFIGGFSAKAPLFHVMLVFTETYPFDPQKPEQLTSIFYTAETQTTADRQRFEQAALAKYGAPVTYAPGVGGKWCNRGEANAAGQYVCFPDAPNLVLKGTELILGDNTVAAKEREEWNMSSHGTPPL